MKTLLGLSLVLVLSVSAVAAQSTGATRIAFDYSDLYARVNPSIVKIHADAGHGSGFLVRSDGLIATNHHVVANARYLAVQFADGRKVAAEAVILNPRYDLAILKVNRSTVAGLTPLLLMTDEKERQLRAGVPVVAFGSPRSQTFMITQGVLSKVEENSLIGDFLVQPGNSGGPLANTDGEVIGINSFLSHGTISGAVRVRLLRETLARLEADSSAIDEPPADLLPTLRASRYPTELLKSKILNEPLDPEVYKLDGGKFTVVAVTPVLSAKTQIQKDLVEASNRYKRRGKKIKDPSYQAIDEPYYEWARDADSGLDCAVAFEIKPDFGMTTGSKWALGFAAALGGRQVMDNLQLNIEYKAEFSEFRLYRDGKLVAPVTPGRAITEQALAGGRFLFVDEAYSGWYLYDPSVFMTGDAFRLEVYDAREPDKVHKTINLKADSKLIKQIRADFAGVISEES